MRQVPPRRHKIITLLTDFGLSDPYVAMMKGVILTLNPRAAIVDISHEVPPGDVMQAAFMLFHTYRYFPAGAIHVSVVDPGVGTGRRAVLLVTPDAFFLAPDNGLLSYIIGPGRGRKAGLRKLDSSFQAFSLDNRAFWRDDVSRTFHGRDIFAPVAAHLSLGVKPGELGERVDSLLALPVSYPRRASSGEMIGEVAYVDRFGNLITNIPSEMVPHGATVRIAGRDIKGLSSSYEAGEDLLAIAGSFGLLEIACKGGSASNALKIEVGSKVTVLCPFSL